MQVKITKQEKKHFILLSDFGIDLKSYSVLYSWNDIVEEGQCDEIPIENSSGFYRKERNSTGVHIEVSPIGSPKDYIILHLNDRFGKKYPFYIDYNNFYSIEKGKNVYFHHFEEFHSDLEEKNGLKHYLKGLYGDIHLLDLVSYKERIFHYLVPDKSLLNSPSYKIIIEKNEEAIYIAPFGIHTKEEEFAIIHEEFGSCYKYEINQKINNKCITEVNVYDDKGNKISTNNTFFSNKKNSQTFKISYLVKESNYTDPISKSKTLHYSPNGVTSTIEKFEYHANTTSEKLVLTWEINSNKKLYKKIIINGKNIPVEDDSITFNKLEEIDNGTKTIQIRLVASYDESFKDSFESSLIAPNLFYLNNVNSFKPSIDYSDVLYNNKPYGNLRWTTPSQYSYSLVKISGDLIDKFLDEYRSPWIFGNTIVSKSGADFDLKYIDYSEDHIYDFNNKGGTLSNNVNNSFLTKKISETGFIVEGNTLRLPIWFTKENSEYKVKIELYNFLSKKIGENEVSFSILENEPSSILDEDILFKRGQKIQFGESGSIGEFYKIENKKPIDVKMSYENPVYSGTPLYDYSNIDSNNNSMAFYFNSKESEFLEVNFKRSSNFSIFSCIIIKDEIEIHSQKIVPLGNEFKDNKFFINKSKFKEGGEYIMRLQTFNYNGKGGKVKELKFLVNNENPEKPIIEIPKNYFQIIGERIVLNKKTFILNIINNKESKNYSGWQYKEAHFYFSKEINGTYDEYPTYVVQSDKSNGDLSLKNSVQIENGEYKCKVVCYDYSGNASEETEFFFTMKNNITITPQELFSNKPSESFKWYIKKPEDSEGFYYYLRYSKDGVNFQNTTPVKVISPWYHEDKGTSEEYILDINFVKENGKYIDALYSLVCYEHSLHNTNGYVGYEFGSNNVDVDSSLAPSNPIFSKESKTVRVYNKNQHNEWAYTNDLNDVVLTTLHDKITQEIENGNIIKQTYKIVLVSPNKEFYSFNILDTPNVVSVIEIDKLCEKAGITTRTEGVWEIRFVTCDIYENSNEERGYYTYYINQIRRIPIINNVTINGQNNNNFFGLNSEKITFSVDGGKLYEDIVNYEEHLEKFTFEYIEKRIFNEQTNIETVKTTNYIGNTDYDMLNPLTEDEKLTHTRDGKYIGRFGLIDPIGRKSSYFSTLFNIDTEVSDELIFVGGGDFFSKTIDLKAITPNDILKVYYKIYNKVDDYIDYFEDEQEEKVVNVSSIEDNLTGIEIKDLSFSEDGYKLFVYRVEETSGNISKPKVYRFKIDSVTKVIPIFNYSNKVFFGINDAEVKISWDKTRNLIEEFEVMLEKITVGEDGIIIPQNSYKIFIGDETVIVPVGPSETNFFPVTDKKEISFSIGENYYMGTGYYRLTVKGINSFSGEVSYNSFLYQIDLESFEVIDTYITNNKITVTSKFINWDHIKKASYYEISYDKRNWIKVYNNYFYINEDSVVKETDDKTYVYLRWMSKSGLLSETSKIPVEIKTYIIEKPKVYNHEGNVTENNKILEWTIEVENPEIASIINYSFDKQVWNSVPVKGTVNKLIDQRNNGFVKDGIYDIFVTLSDGDILERENISSITHAKTKVFSSQIPIPTFRNLSNGITINKAEKLFINNKVEGVIYEIYVNDILVGEGYELSSSVQKKFNIVVEAFKEGINKKEQLITKEDEYNIWSLTTEDYMINVNNSQLVCTILPGTTNITIKSMIGKRENQTILYRKKGDESGWKILFPGDTISLENEWEFNITSFNVVK